jgi:hypothetical protein
LPATGAAFAFGSVLVTEPGAAQAQTGPALQPGHFHPKGKVPSDYTQAVYEAATKDLPFDDTRDFDEFNKGFIARRSDPVIPSDTGGVAWDDSQWAFLDGDGPFDAIHPSLLRIARLNRNFGLYEVVPGTVYQVHPVDIRGLDQTPMLFPAHNILFVGTMNDDESTQSLSDKVLDRGNVLQFPAPAKFASASTAQPAPPDPARSFGQWRHRMKGPDAMDDSARTLVSDTVTGLAGIMQRFGRPFGHRLARSIETYAANYPHEGNGGPDLRVPLADQIEFRILPKLRGIEIDNSRPAFDELARLVSVQLQDGQLGQRIEALRDEQAQAAGLFVWRGLDRDG